MKARYRRAICLGLPFALLGLLQAYPYAVERRQSQLAFTATLAAHDWRADDFGGWPSGWEVASAERVQRNPLHLEGHYSLTLKMRHPSKELHATLSLDYPFDAGWHELTDCYRMSGWTVGKINQVALLRDGQATCTQAELASADGVRGRLFFSLLDVEGTTVAPPEQQLARELWRRMKRQSYLDPSPTYFQVQLFATAPTRPTDGDLAELGSLFRHFLDQVRDQLRRVAQQVAH